MKTKLFLASALLLTTTVTSAFATAEWVNYSAVCVNGTWYNCSSNNGWCTGGVFNGANLGAISTLSIGGQSYVHDYNGSNWGQGTMTMGYSIDGVDNSHALTFKSFDDVNKTMCFESGGSNWVPQTIDISGLNGGKHTLAVWFTSDGQWDSNNGNNYVATFTINKPITLANDANNTPILNRNKSYTGDVVLNGLTLYKDNCWNSLCLPFGLSSAEIASSPLAGATINKLTSSSFLDGKLSLTFNNSTEIEAGVPYLIKWGSGDNITNPEFQGVTITQSQAGEFAGNFVYFKGTFDQITFDEANDHIYFLGEGNGLFYPEAGASIRAFGAYFFLTDPLLVKAFQLNFDEETNSIQAISNETDAQNDGYYTIDGRRINGMPATSGLYILNGKKVMIK